MTNINKTLRALDDTRREYGAESTEGRLCSNAIEQIRNLEHATGDQRVSLIKFLDDTMRRMAKFAPPASEQ